MAGWDPIPGEAPIEVLKLGTPPECLTGGLPISRQATSAGSPGPQPTGRPSVAPMAGSETRADALTPRTRVLKNPLENEEVAHALRSSAFTWSQFAPSTALLSQPSQLSSWVA
jgi:hypothetical protein